MKFTFLGTAAAEGWPSVFCNCDFCNKAREVGGKDIRTRSQSMIDDVVLIDFPTDTYHHALVNSLNLSKIEYVFITHTHNDHFQPLDLLYRGSCYAHNFISPTIEFVGNEEMNNQMDTFLSNIHDSSIRDNIISTYIEPYSPKTFGEYTLTALKAQHKPNEVPYVYLIQKGEKSVLYLHDTGVPFDEVFEYLVKIGMKLDMVTYDCTHVLLENRHGHMGLPNCVEVRDRLAADGVITDKTINIINHFSHNNGVLYDELASEAAKKDFLVSYDGMEINL